MLDWLTVATSAVIWSAWLGFTIAIANKFNFGFLNSANLALLLLQPLSWCAGSAKCKSESTQASSQQVTFILIWVDHFLVYKTSISVKHLKQTDTHKYFSHQSLQCSSVKLFFPLQLCCELMMIKTAVAVNLICGLLKVMRRERFFVKLRHVKQRITRKKTTAISNSGS